MRERKCADEETDGDYENQRENLEARMMRVDEMRTLFNLHNDVWEDALLEPPFLFYYLKVLHPRERQIVDKRVAGLSILEIATEMRVSESTVLRSIYNIRYVFRNKARPRVNKFWKDGKDNGSFIGWKKGSWRG